MRVARRKTAASQVAKLRGSLRDIERQYVTLKRGPHEGWHQIGQPGEPEFRFGWSNAQTSTDNHDLGNTPPASFFKDNDSIVWLRGVIQRNKAATATIAFVLPPAYRPAFHHTVGLGQDTVQIRKDGALYAIGEADYLATAKNDADLYVSGNGSPDTTIEPAGQTTEGIPERRVFSLGYIRFRAAS